MLVMDQNQSKAYSRNPMGTETNNGEISNRTVEADTFRSNFEVQSEEGSNKCSQCDFASSEAGDLRRHLKTQSGEKLNKCNQCEFVSSWSSSLKIHLKRHS